MSVKKCFLWLNCCNLQKYRAIICKVKYDKYDFRQNMINVVSILIRRKLLNFLAQAIKRKRGVELLY